MTWLTGKHTFRMAIREGGKIDHTLPECQECGKTISGKGILIAAHPAEFDNEGGMEYSGDQIRECSAFHKECAENVGWMGQKIKCSWV